MKITHKAQIPDLPHSVAVKDDLVIWLYPDISNAHMALLVIDRRTGLFSTMATTLPLVIHVFSPHVQSSHSTKRHGMEITCYGTSLYLAHFNYDSDLVPSIHFLPLQSITSSFGENTDLNTSELFCKQEFSIPQWNPFRESASWPSLGTWMAFSDRGLLNFTCALDSLDRVERASFTSFWQMPLSPTPETNLAPVQTITYPTILRASIQTRFPFTFVHQSMTVIPWIARRDTGNLKYLQFGRFWSGTGSPRSMVVNSDTSIDCSTVEPGFIFYDEASGTVYIVSDDEKGWDLRRFVLKCASSCLSEVASKLMI